MNRLIRNLSVVFAAGAFGGIVNAFFVWLFGRIGIAAFFGVNISPVLNEAYIYPKIFWGGVWGILFLLPFTDKKYFTRGIIYSIAPSLVMLFVVFPFWLYKGMMGLELGGWTPVFVFVYNIFWGLGAALWLKLSTLPE